MKTGMEEEYKIKRHVTEHSDGSKTYWDDLCDDYGLSLMLTITHYDKNGKLIGKPTILMGP